jgi:hypothetical protein
MQKPMLFCLLDARRNSAQLDMLFFTTSNRIVGIQTGTYLFVENHLAGFPACSAGMGSEGSPALPIVFIV